MPVKILITENDVNLAFALASRFAKDFFQKIDLQIITEEKYIHEVPKGYLEGEILIYNPGFITPEKEGIRADEWFCITDQLYGLKEFHKERRISRSRNPREIFSEIVVNSRILSERESENPSEPQLIVVTAAAGGTGKTTIAMGIASVLNRMFPRTLYICGEQMQSFRSFLKDGTWMSGQTVQQIRDGGEYPILPIRGSIRTEASRYLPPVLSEFLFEQPGKEFLLKCIRTALCSGEYDFVVVDTDCVYDFFKRELIKEADHIFIVYNDDCKKSLAGKLSEYFGNAEKAILVCNRKAKETVFGNESAACSESVFVEEFGDYSFEAARWFSGSNGIQKLVQRFIR